MEPLNNGYPRDQLSCYFVLYRERLSLRQKCTSMIDKGPEKVFYCVLYSKHPSLKVLLYRVQVSPDSCLTVRVNGLEKE